MSGSDYGNRRKNHLETKHKRSCRRKQAYTEQEAKKVAGDMINSGKFVHAYQCNICGKWHVGKASRKWRLRMAFKLMKEIERGK